MSEISRGGPCAVRFIKRWGTWKVGDIFRTQPNVAAEFVRRGAAVVHKDIECAAIEPVAERAVMPRPEPKHVQPTHYGSKRRRGNAG
jgi:hypothetical protein